MVAMQYGQFLWVKAETGAGDEQCQKSSVTFGSFRLYKFK